MPSTIQPTYPLIFATLLEKPEQVQQLSLLVASLRAFGGALRDAQLLVFVSPAMPGSASMPGQSQANLQYLPLQLPEHMTPYLFAEKVHACAQAEALCQEMGRTLAWLNPECLLVGAPLDFNLAPPHQAAVRPVHHRNIGSLLAEPLDAYWRRVYQAVGMTDAPYAVRSFVDQQELRPYYNTHCFALHPRAGLMAAWMEAFTRLVEDEDFQAQECQAVPRRVFLHQALFSALLASRLGQGRVRLLPPTYSYPLHLHNKLPPERQARRLNDLVLAVYEEQQYLDSLPVDEPLRSWLASFTA